MRSNRAKSAGEMHLLKNDISEKYDGDGGQPHIGGRGLLVYDVIMIVIGVTTWPGNAKLMRAQALSLRERTFVQSAVALGETKPQILFKYILPNGIFPVVANTTRGMAGAILTEAALSFLGLGDPNIISWGQMIYQGKSYTTSAWWISAFSGIAVIITVIFFYMLGDGLNHVFNPKYNYGRSK